MVDDDPLVLDTSALILKEHGYEARTVSDGFEALVELRRSKPDLIISRLENAEHEWLRAFVHSSPTFPPIFRQLRFQVSMLASHRLA
jgi:DNA-binding NtrC family response regulator